MCPQLFSTLSSPANNNTGARRIHSYRNFVTLVVDFHPGNAAFSALFLNCLAQLQILVQKLSIMLLIIPLRLPATDDADSKTVRMNFMSHFALPPRRQKH